MKIYIYIVVIAFLLMLVPASSLYADTCPTEDFQNYSNSLDNTKISSVQQLTNRLRESSNGMSEKCISKLIDTYYRYYLNAIVAYDRAENIMGVYPSDKVEQEINSKVAAVGWKLLMTEGTYYIGEDGTWIAKELSEILPDDWKEYFTFRGEEIKEGFSEDAILLISWHKLYLRIKHWETFIKKYPTFPLNEHIESYLSLYVRTFLTGMDNSRITEGYEGNNLRNDVRKSYELFLSDNKSSKYYRVVEGYYGILKSSKFILTDDARDFLNSNDVRSMIAVQPPTY